MSEHKPISLSQVAKPEPPEVPAREEGEEPKTLHDKVVRACSKVYDPEIPVNIYDLGLIYKIDANEETKRVVVDMTLTTPNCPVADSLPNQVRANIEAVEGIGSVQVNLVWSPPWDKSKMSEDAKLILGMD